MSMMMRQIERFVSAASLPVGRLLELAGLKGTLLAESVAVIEALALASQRDRAIVVPAAGTSVDPQAEDATDPADWLVQLLADGVVEALAPSRTRRQSPRSALADSLRGSRKLERTLRLLRSLCRSDGARVTEALGAPGAPEFMVHAPIDLEYAWGRSSRISFTENLLRAREIMRTTQARVLALVPFEPRRPAALAIVREAMSRGFVGVVLEMRDGLRVHGNTGSAAARDIERGLIDLYSYCAEAGVPLLVPCRSAFDEGPADIRGRLRDLKRLLSTRRFAKLRLCIGGVGSLDGWAAAKRGDRAAFARSEAGLALALAETFSNVVCDVGAAWPDGTRNVAAIQARIDDAAQRKRAIDGKLIGAGRDDTLVEWLRFASLASAPVGLDESEERAITVAATRETAAAGTPRSRSLAAPVVSAGGVVHDCLVLGAGISGVTAARTIASQRRGDGSAPSVLILEGSQRIGGRMHTLRDSRVPIPVEMGAELIHRPEQDQASGGFRLWDEVRRYGLATRPIHKTSTNHVFLRAWSSNTNGPKLRGALGTCSDIDVGNGKRVLDSCMRVRHGADRSALAQRDLVLADFNARRANAEDMADYLLTGTVPGELADLSTAGLGADRVKEQEFSAEEFHVAAGYDTLPRLIASGLPIEFGAKVRRIEWWNAHGNAGVRVVTDDGREFLGRSAVCSFSVGVLQRGGIEFARVLPDAPLTGLPQSKLEALERVGFGAESKLIMQFRRRFWPDDLSILSSPGSGMRAGRSFFNPSYQAPGSPAVFTAFLTRKSAEEFDSRVGVPERWKDDGHPHGEDHIKEYIVTKALADLIEILDLPAAKRPSIDDVTYWHCRCWGKDPLVLGGTSYLKFSAGTSCATMRGARAALADASETKPLFWAGEACAVNTNPWSVHGAHMSGLAAGLDVSRHLGF